MKHSGALRWAILVLLVVLVYPEGVRANGPIPESYPALEEIKAQSGSLRDAGIAMMICGGALAVGGATLLAGNDGGDEITAGAAVLGGGVMMTASGYLVTRLHRSLVDWLP